MMAIRAFIYALCLAVCTLSPASEARMTAHLIPHSHCDPGWLETFGQYYHRSVHKILDNVVNSLKDDPTKRFVWAEISFFSVWYESQPDAVRDTVRRLAHSGQLEFVEGGWVQADEATTHPDSIIQHITEGHDYLLKNIGVKPRIGWQIDPFGHSSLTPTLFARMGFDAMVINRIHFNIKGQLKQMKAMEFMWQPSDTLGSNAKIYTHVLHTHYSAPKGFDFEESWSSVQVNRGNLKSRAELLARELKQRQTSYPSSHQLVPYGDDFKFQNSRIQWSNMDQLVKEINDNADHYGLTIKYSTLSEYFSEVSREKQTVSLITSDFMPYADNANAYWTGYYTSRPLTKGVVRRSMATVRTADIFYALFRSTFNVKADTAAMYGRLQEARRAIALAQHHDGITGTSRKAVDDDYRARMLAGKGYSEEVISTIASHLHRVKGPALSNIRADHTSHIYEINDAWKSNAIIVMNSLSWHRKAPVTVLVRDHNYQITDATGKPIKSQLAETFDQSPSGSSSPRTDSLRLTFIADIPPLGSAVYLLKRAPEGGSKVGTDVYTSGGGGGGLRGGGGGGKDLRGARIILENDFIVWELDNESGLVGHVTNKRTGRKIFLSQDILEYQGPGSGSYIFRADHPPTSHDLKNKPKIVRVVDGPVYAEVTTCVDGLTFIQTIYKGPLAELGAMVDLEIKFVSVGPNKNLVTEFQSALKTRGVFYTDNGVEWRRREYTPSRAIPANYYPMVTSAALQAGKHMLTVMNAQSNGVTSRKDGMLELMLHRQLMQDDGRGLSQPNHDTSVVDYHMYYMFNEAEVGTQLRPRLVLALNNPVSIRVEDHTRPPEDWTNGQYRPDFAPLNAQAVPEHTHVQLLQARHHNGQDTVLRLQNLYETTSGFKKAAELTDEVQLHAMFRNLKVTGLRETTLAMTYPASHQRLDFADNNNVLKLTYDPSVKVFGASQNTEEEGVFLSDQALQHRMLLSLISRDNPNAVSVKITPLEIKSFYLTLTPSDAPIAPPLVEVPAVPPPSHIPTQVPATPAQQQPRNQQPPQTAVPVVAQTTSTTAAATAAATAATHTVQQTQIQTQGQEVIISQAQRVGKTNSLHHPQRRQIIGDWGHDEGHFHAGQNEFVIVMGISLVGIGLMIMAFYRLNNAAPSSSRRMAGTAGTPIASHKKH